MRTKSEAERQKHRTVSQLQFSLTQRRKGIPSSEIEERGKIGNEYGDKDEVGA